VFAQIKKLLLGNGLAQGLQLGSLLVLSRIYAPADFGLLAQVQSVATLLAIAATLQLHLVVPLTSDEAQARACVVSVEFICLALLCLAAVPALLHGAHLPYAIVLAACIGLSNTYNGYLVYSGSFGQLSAFYVARAVIVIAFQLLLAAAHVPHGLVWAAIAGELCAALYLRQAKVGLKGLPVVNPAEAWSLARKFRAFSVFGTLQELTSASAFYAPLILFATTFGKDVGGQYAMTNRLVWAPVVLVSGSLAQVLYHRLGKNPPTSMKILLPPRQLLLSIGAVSALAGLSFLLERPTQWALGPQWALAGEFVPPMVISGCAFLMSIPFRVTCRVLHLQRLQLTLDVLLLASIYAVFASGATTPLQTMWILAALSGAQAVLLSLIARFGMNEQSAEGTSV